MPDRTLSLPDDQDDGPVDDGKGGPTAWFVAEVMAFVAALLGAGLLLQVTLG
jgi:hypothetical protein